MYVTFYCPQWMETTCWDSQAGRHGLLGGYVKWKNKTSSCVGNSASLRVTWLQLCE